MHFVWSISTGITRPCPRTRSSPEARKRRRYGWKTSRKLRTKHWARVSRQLEICPRMKSTCFENSSVLFLLFFYISYFPLRKHFFRSNWTQNIAKTNCKIWHFVFLQQNSLYCKFRNFFFEKDLSVESSRSSFSWFLNKIEKFDYFAY